MRLSKILCLAAFLVSCSLVGCGGGSDSGATLSDDEVMEYGKKFSENSFLKNSSEGEQKAGE